MYYGVGVASTIYVLVAVFTVVALRNAGGHSGGLSYEVIFLLPLVAAFISYLCFWAGTKAYQYRRSDGYAFGCGAVCAAVIFLLVPVFGVIPILLLPVVSYFAPTAG